MGSQANEATVPQTKTQRRSRWQALAHRKYGRMVHLGGDGAKDGECWVAMSKCKRGGTHAWSYVLRPSWAEAQTVLEDWDSKGCSAQCEGPGCHKLWKLAD